MKYEAFLHEYPGWQYRLTRFLGEQEAVTVAEEVGALVGAFRSVVVPLAADIAVRCCDRELFLPEQDQTLAHPARRLRSASCPPGAEPSSHHTEPVEVQRLDANTLQTHVREMLEQPCPEPDDYRACLTELRCWATRAWLGGAPSGGDEGEAPVLTLQGEQGTPEVPSHREDDGLWVAGPVAPLASQPPVRLVFSQDAGMATFDVFVHWSPWTRSDSAAGAALRDALRRVEGRGWELVHEPVSGPAD
jgi:hypothetical protein